MMQYFMGSHEDLFDGISLSLTLNKSAILEFPPTVPVHIWVVYREEVILQGSYVQRKF